MSFMHGRAYINFQKVRIHLTPNDGISCFVSGFSRVLSQSVLTLLLWSSGTNLYTSICVLHVFQLDGAKVFHS